MKNLSLTKSIIVIAIVTVGCSHQKVREDIKKTIIESSIQGEKPEWALKSVMSWKEEMNHFYKSQYTIQENQRVNACYDLAKMELRENIMTELSSEIKGEIVLALKGSKINYNELMTKTMIQSFEGRLQGLKIQEQFHERYLIREREQVDCFVKASIDKESYRKLKNELLNQMAEESGELKKAIENRQVGIIK